MFSIFAMIGLDPVAGISVSYDENICEQETTCYQIRVTSTYESGRVFDHDLKF